MSPFAAALLAHNLALACYFLELEKGVADMSNLFLENLPQTLIDWKGGLIRELDLRNNRLNLLPSSLRHIEKVHLSGNPLLCLPQHLRAARWSKVREYLDETQRGDVTWNVRKVILLGEEGAGKTTLSQALSTKHGKVNVTQK